MNLVVLVYALTEKYPKSEVYGLVSQMRRCAISVPSNIAEGRRRGTRKDFKQFLTIAYGSGAELETQLEIAKRLRFGEGNGTDHVKVDNPLNEIMRMLNGMIGKLKS